MLGGVTGRRLGAGLAVSRVTAEDTTRRRVKPGPRPRRVSGEGPPTPRGSTR